MNNKRIMELGSNVPIFVMLVGIPGAGKSTMAEKLRKLGYHVHSTDQLRLELLGDVNDQSQNDMIIETVQNNIIKDLKAGYNCVYDACNKNKKRRRGFIQAWLKDVQCIKECYFIATPIEQCLNQDATREKTVGEDVVNRFYYNINIPTYREGWDNIELIYPDNCKLYDSIELLTRLSSIAQNNPHHTHTIGEHCLMCANAVWKDNRFFDLSIKQQTNVMTAALYHDIGKEKTATYINSKGERTNVCHFYGHENVSAYDFLFMDVVQSMSHEDILATADLIQNHMKLYSNPGSSKYMDKLKRRYGKEMYDMLNIIHFADKNSK